MRYAIAIWNFGGLKPAPSLPALIGQFADFGFDAISFLPVQIAGASPEQRRAIISALDARRLAATVHGNCAITEPDARAIVETLGDRLLAFTCDAAEREDSRGKFFDAPRIAAVLTMLQDLTRGTATRLAMEDFPLDALARDHFRAELGRVLDHERTGILVDIGHMNLRCTRAAYFREAGVAGYFARLPVPVVEVHIHDNNGKADEHRPMGQGTIRFEDVARALRGLKFDGVSTIEVAPSLHGGSPEECLALSRGNLAEWRRLMS